VLWLPPLGWEVGYLFWGWVLDHARGQDRFGRLFRLLAALGLPFVATPFVPSLAGMMALMFWAIFVSAGFVIVSLGEITDRHPQRHAGYLGGFGAGSWAVLMFVAHPLFGRMLDQHRYVLCYAVSTAGPLVGLLAWTILSPRRRSHAPSAVLS
jgi:MFS transporter, ACS family, hexuronate transporter